MRGGTIPYKPEAPARRNENRAKWQNGQSWLDHAGNHATNQLTVTERFRLLDSNHISNEATLDNPQTFTQPWSSVGRSKAARRPC